MQARELEKLGIPQGPVLSSFLERIDWLRDEGMSTEEISELYRHVADDPESFFDHNLVSDLARELEEATVFSRHDDRAPWKQWGDDLDPAALEQMENACRLPIARRGAVMADAHRGYGLPIGGVLATEGAVIPYAVGVDIACRMKLSVFDMPPETIDDEADFLANTLEYETAFGVGSHFKKPRDHEVMDEDWNVSPITRQNKERARSQLGSSGSGNHFAEFGILTLEDRELGLEPGRYLALLTHSGSRGVGAAVADHYSKLAKKLHPELPKELNQLAWLDLDSQPGREYWAAMQLMGKYASANHAVIHREIRARLAARVIAGVENHHNFAWKEIHDGREVIVHRKGATPANKGELGVIPGSMTAPAYVVRGKGEESSLHSAAHGAGRVMSRSQARRSISWNDVEAELEEKGVHLLSAGLDEAPAVYKDIDEVMEAQSDLVETIARFDPRIVKMAPSKRSRR